MKYKFYYEIDRAVHHRLARCEKVIDAPTPIKALDMFHKFMQESHESHYLTRDVVRPRLTHSQYKIHRLMQVYHDTPRALGGTGEVIEAIQDLPSSPNPDLTAKVPDNPSDTAEMRFE